MKRHYHLIAATLASAGLGLAASAAIADCASELATLPGTSKAGTAAPLSSGATPQTGGMERSPAEAAKGAGKDGTLMPMGADPTVATSAEDAQAQSEGGKTAAQQAAGEAGSGDVTRQGAIDEARAALASGDEKACMAALETAKGL